MNAENMTILGLIMMIVGLVGVIMHFETAGAWVAGIGVVLFFGGIFWIAFGRH